MPENSDSRAGFESARLRLARLRLDGESARQAAMQQVAHISAHALGVERVGIWSFEDGGQTLRSLCVYQQSTDSFSSDIVLDAGRFPAYVAAIRERRVLAVTEARSHPTTSELVEGYLDVHGITSMLDAPVIRDGGLAGVVCHEHVGPPRVWSQKERDFAASVADMAALFLEQADRVEIEAALHEQRNAAVAQEKMAALGRLARAVAHDVNNVLGALDMIGVAILEEPAEAMQAHGADIRRVVGLGTRLVEQLFLFGRPAEGTPVRVKLGPLLLRMEPILHRLVRGARLEIDIATADTTVLADPAQMEQVVLNLCLNAAEAVAEDGVIRIELREAGNDDPVGPGNLLLVVADNGHGMDPATLSHIFEPYFTRKPGGHGIGLATVYAIVKRFEGTIAVDSAPGSGTTFTVGLPIAPGDGPA